MLGVSESIVSVREVVATDSSLELCNFLLVLFLADCRWRRDEVMAVNTGVLRHFSHTMSPGLFT